MSRPTARVVVRTPLPDGSLSPLEGKAEMRLVDGDAPRSVLLETLADADALIAMLFDRVDEELLTRAPRLRIVANAAVGYDNVDLDAAQRAGIWVTNTPDVLTEATADLTLALILAVTRRLSEAETELREGRYRGWTLTHMLGTGLQGKTLGIVGCGRIGRAVAKRAAAFGMKVACASRVGGVAPIEDATSMALEDLLAQSDIVTLHVPLSEATYHLIDAEALARMRAGAYLINTSRGRVVDEEAVAAALVSGRLAGAGLDVFEREPHVHPDLLYAPNAVLLPHIGSATRETRLAMASLAAENVAALLEGREPLTPVLRGTHAETRPAQSPAR